MNKGVQELHLLMNAHIIITIHLCGTFDFGLKWKHASKNGPHFQKLSNYKLLM